MRLYGASTADYAIRAVSAVDVGGTAVPDLTQLAPNTTWAVATEPAAGSRITSGLYDLSSGAISEVTSDADGEIRFQGDDALPLDLWLAELDGAGNVGSKWYVVRAADLGAAVTSAASSAESAAAAAQSALAQITTLDVADRLAALEATAVDVSALQAQLADLEAAVSLLQSGGVPNAITSPDGSVTAIEIGTAVENETRRPGLPASHVLVDRG